MYVVIMYVDCCMYVLVYFCICIYVSVSIYLFIHMYKFIRSRALVPSQVIKVSFFLVFFMSSFVSLHSKFLGCSLLPRVPSVLGAMQCVYSGCV